jgi:hypothetical protein
MANRRSTSVLSTGKSDDRIQFGTRPNRIDLMNFITGVSFREAWAGRIDETIPIRDGDAPLPIIGIDALKKNKQALGRHRDLDDLQYISGAPAGKRKT